MIGYTCKYTPIELLHALGAQTYKIDDETNDFTYAETLTHPTLCTHAKALLEHSRDMDEMILVNCCDAIRRARDVLHASGRQDSLYFVDLPHSDTACARDRLRTALACLKETYCGHHGARFDRQAFLSACGVDTPHAPTMPYIAVMGARASRELLQFMRQTISLPLHDLTCGGNRSIGPVPPDVNTDDFDALMNWYAGELLRMTPCMRMTDIAGRRQLTEDDNLKGILYNTVKFCDYYSFDYARLQNECAAPMLKFESDFTPQARGQLATRLEAFQERIMPSKNKTQDKVQTTGGKGLYAGIDSGSTTTNMAVLNERRELVASAIVRTGAKAQNGAEAALASVCQALDLSAEDFACIIATGYGRSHIPFATDTKTEITCHAKGAHFLHPDARTIIDIGGQDSKVICLDAGGNVANFLMNDKCAAGTGRFLEMMARTLEIDMEEMSRLGANWQRDLTISSMCSVFAESEVISLIAENHSAADIIRGLNKSVASRTASMAIRAKAQAPYVMTGGVARNRGVVDALEEKLDTRIVIPDVPDLCGAIGAALSGLDA